MLKKFAVENYRGFENRIELDLSNTSNYEFNTFAIKNGIIKNGILYGPNGSGKTNFSLAIFDVVNHLTQKHRAADYYNNFVCAKRFDEEVKFEYVFSFDEQEVKYFYSKDKKGTLVSEMLFVNELLVLTWGGKDSDVFVAPEFNITEETLNGLKENSNNVYGASKEAPIFIVCIICGALPHAPILLYVGFHPTPHKPFLERKGLIPKNFTARGFLFRWLQPKLSLYPPWVPYPLRYLIKNQKHFAKAKCNNNMQRGTFLAAYYVIIYSTAHQ
jgi:hypothetical protein